jgi:protein-disulfide isomerase
MSGRRQSRSSHARHFEVHFLLLITFPLPAICLGQTGQASKHAQLLAVVGDQPITEDDLPASVQGQLKQIKEQEYQVKRKALQELINQRLLEAEARKEGVASTEKLLQQEVDSRVPEPTDVELKAIYAVQKEQMGNPPFADAKAQLAQNLKKARIQQARLDYDALLASESKIAILVVPPRTQVAFDPARVRGNPRARVIIVEFSDFQCPYCSKVQSTLKNLLAKYPDSLALAFRDMPLQQIHPLAPKAAEAARCAGEQGKFWEYHDLLFAGQDRLDQAGLMDKARTLKLDDRQFESCLSSDKYKGLVQQDVQEGMRAGVLGTPAFFINGVFLSGLVPQSTFESVIQEQLPSAAE